MIRARIDTPCGKLWVVGLDRETIDRLLEGDSGVFAHNDTLKEAGGYDGPDWLIVAAETNADLQKLIRKLGTVDDDTVLVKEVDR